jgi:hypothetical protein
MRILILSVFAFAAYACGGAEVNVRNQSSTRLQDVVISAEGDSAAIDAVEPSAGGKTTICPKGETGSLELSFMADGKWHHSKHSLYFECNSSYRVLLNVSPEFETAAAVTLK